MSPIDVKNRPPLCSLSPIISISLPINFCGQNYFDVKILFSRANDLKKKKNTIYFCVNILNTITENRQMKWTGTFILLKF